MDDMLNRTRRTLSAMDHALCGWINGTVPNDESGYEPVVTLCHPDISVVHPNGEAVRDGKILADMRDAHGANPDFRLYTPLEHVRILHQSGDMVIAESIELQAGARAVSKSCHARRITAVLLADAKAPHGLVIHRLHESIVPEAEESSFDWSPLEA